MISPALRPSLTYSDASCEATPSGDGPPTGSSASSRPKKRRVRPGWKATLVRDESFAKLRALQKSTVDPCLDLSYLTDACLQIALEIGEEAIVARALRDLRPRRFSS